MTAWRAVILLAGGARLGNLSPMLTNAPHSLCVHCATPQETATLGARLGQLLRIGDVVLLQGEIGTGKTHFARALIQNLQNVPEDVPSPSFTLIQTYETQAGEIWHADLYRLGGGAELDELGLDQAAEEGILLVEWPDQVRSHWPDTALRARFEIDPDTQGRRVSFHWTAPRWSPLTKALTP